MVTRVFIDGEAGTTGLQIRARLAGRLEFDVLTIDGERRKEEAARRALLNSADVVVLCLPDPAAREAVALVENDAVRIIDASTAHRVAEGWIYGLPELAPGQAEAIRQARRIANPGCYATGVIALLRPLVDAGVIPSDWPVSVNAVSGYSGGGRAMIDEYEAPARRGAAAPPYRIYGLELAHKHLPEMVRYTGLSHEPIFAPAVGRYAQGMIVEVPLPLWAIPGRPRMETVRRVLENRYAGTTFIKVVSEDETAKVENLEPQELNGTNRMHLYVFGGQDQEQARLVALLDNLGKGASGAAIQNLNLLAGLDEAAGL